MILYSFGVNLGLVAKLMVSNLRVVCSSPFFKGLGLEVYKGVNHTVSVQQVVCLVSR